MSQQLLSHDRIGGFHAVQSALESERPIHQLWIGRGRRGGRLASLVDIAQRRGVPVSEVAMATLDEWLPDVRHQGCVLAFEVPREYRESELPELLAQAARPCVLALDQVQDPHNLGACLRSAAAAGVTAVIAPRKRAAGLTAAARKVSAGAAERVPFVRVTNLGRALQRLKQDGFWVAGLDGGAEDSIHEADLAGPVALVAGGEARGMRELTARHCDWQVRIPMKAGMESLNVSVATGIALFELVRRGLI